MKDWLIVVFDVVVLGFIYYKIVSRDRKEEALNAANED